MKKIVLFVLCSLLITGCVPEQPKQAIKQPISPKLEAALDEYISLEAQNILKKDYPDEASFWKEQTQILKLKNEYINKLVYKKTLTDQEKQFLILYYMIRDLKN